MSYQVILQYEMEFDDKTGLPIGSRPKLVKGWIPRRLDGTKKKVEREIRGVELGESIEL